MDSSSSSTVGSRRGRQLHPIQTNVKSQPTRPKPPPPEYAHGDPSAERVPLRTPLKPQSSKSSLKNLLFRTKSSRRPPTKNELALPAIYESHKPSALSPNTEAALPSAISSSLLTPTTTNCSMSATPSRNPSPSATPKLVKVPTEEPSPTVSSWNPPALFKAYPQAIKHATLLSPTISADSILRIHAHKRDGSDKIDPTEGPVTTKRRKDEKKETHHSRRTSDALSKVEWSRKIYMLVTSGFLLQYSGEGSFDRKPEKVVPLGKNSVAFASDAIPGKHWVLQISHTQSVKEITTTPVVAKKSFFSRLRGSDTRRAPEPRGSTKSMLLVLEDAEDLSSWLSVVRREINALGSKEYTPDTRREPNAPDLHRFQSTNSRQPKQKKSKTDLTDQPQSPPPTENGILAPPTKPQADDSLDKQVNRNSIRQSVEISSLSTVTTATDLDRLRDISRLSYASIGTRTIPSSRGTSPGPSPAGPKSSTTCRVSYVEASNNQKGLSQLPSADLYLKQNSLARPRSPSPAEESHDEVPKLRATVDKQEVQSTPNFSHPMLSKRNSAMSSRMSMSPRDRSPSPVSHSASQPASPSNLPIQNITTVVNSATANQFDHTAQPKSSPYRDAHHALQSIRTDKISQPSIAPSAKPSRARRYSSFEGNPGMNSLAAAFQPGLATVEDGVQKSSFSNNSSSSHKSATQVVPPRRPQSLQVLPRGHYKTNAVETPNQPGSSRHSSIHAPPRDLSGIRESVTNDETRPWRNSMKTVSSQKSMPLLSLGPPPAPPPDCPLPEVPSIVVPKLSSTPRGNRNSHRRDPSRESVDSMKPQRPRRPYFEHDSRHRLPTAAELEAKRASMVNAF